MDREVPGLILACGLIYGLMPGWPDCSLWSDSSLGYGLTLAHGQILASGPILGCALWSDFGRCVGVWPG